jgi:hypothetical protein
MYIRFISLTFLSLILVTSFLFAQQPKNNPNWDSYYFLIGEWVGEGGGNLGQGAGGFSFSFDLQNQIIVRKNFAEYPAVKDHPAFRHDDLMVMSQENNSTCAMYWDNEGHVINYTVEFSKDTNSVIFLSELVPSAPRFRLTYTKSENNTVKILFEIAPPGKQDSFTKYIEATAHRK